MLALRLPPEIDARLAELAKRTGRSKSFYAREAILAHLDELEDLYLAESRLADLRDERSGSIPLGDLLRRHERAAAGELKSSAPRRLSKFFASCATALRFSMMPDRSVRRSKAGGSANSGNTGSATIA